MRIPFLAAATLILFSCADPQGTADPAATAPAATAAGVQQSAAAAPQPCELLMGWDPWEPYHYRDVDGRMRGLDVELVELITATAGCKVSYVEGRWGTLVKQLQSGEVDMLTGATRTEARESYALFSEPYRSEDFRLYVRTDQLDNYDFENLPELMKSDFRMGVTEQYAYGDLVATLQENPAYADRFIGATISQLNYSRLLEHIIDGFLEDPFVAAWTFRARGLNDQIAAHPIAITSGDVNLMFSKLSVSEQVLARIDESIRAVKDDGRLQAVIDKYLN
jgi:polar amino acid transport system substrate-binding protein